MWEQLLIKYLKLWLSSWLRMALWSFLWEESMKLRSLWSWPKRKGKWWKSSSLTSAMSLWPIFRSKLYDQCTINHHFLLLPLAALTICLLLPEAPLLLPPFGLVLVLVVVLPSRAEVAPDALPCAFLSSQCSKIALCLAANLSILKYSLLHGWLWMGV